MLFIFTSIFNIFFIALFNFDKKIIYKQSEFYCCNLERIFIEVLYKKFSIGLLYRQFKFSHKKDVKKVGKLYKDKKFIKGKMNDVV